MSKVALNGIIAFMHHICKLQAVGSKVRFVSTNGHLADRNCVAAVVQLYFTLDEK